MKITLRPRRSTSLIGPDSIESFRSRLRVGSGYSQTLYAKYLPGHVEPGFLAALYSHRAEVCIALHVEPIPPQVAVQRLKTQRARHESTVRINEARGRITDPSIEGAARSSAELMASISSGESQLFHGGLYVTVKATDPVQLDDEVGRVVGVAASLGIDLRTIEFRGDDPWRSTLPLATDRVGLTHVLNTQALACFFPFLSADIEDEQGILYGRNGASGGVVMVDRFAHDNYNQVVLAHSGKGKSYFAKLQILRSLYRGIEVLVVDPENEYGQLAGAVGGSTIRLGAGGDRINPLHLSHPGEPDALMQQALFIQSLLGLLLGKVSEDEKAEIDKAIVHAYSGAGITVDPRTHSRPAPLLTDLVGSAKRIGSERLVRRLERVVDGPHRILFGGATTVRPEGHLVVFSLRDLPDEIKPAATMLVLDAIWRRIVRGERKRRIVVVDEAWLLLKSDAGARFLERLARSARKYWCGLTTITQDVRDALSTSIGQTIVTNAASQVLFGQHPQGLEALAAAFSLSDGERSYLAGCRAGNGLVCIGAQRAVVEVVASPTEHRLVTSNPAELTESKS